VVRINAYESGKPIGILVLATSGVALGAHHCKELIAPCVLLHPHIGLLSRGCGQAHPGSVVIPIIDEMEACSHLCF
jgi:hypothetical protein